MDLTSIFSDDQLAILGCFGALMVCGLIAAISFHFGPAGQKSNNAPRFQAGSKSAAPTIAAATRDDQSEQRRAA